MSEELKTFDRAYNELFRGRAVNTQHINDCEKIWRAALTQRPAALQQGASDEATTQAQGDSSGDAEVDQGRLRDADSRMVSTVPEVTQRPAVQAGDESAQAEFNRAIDFAIKEGMGAAIFLDAWRHGDTSEWPEFEPAQDAPDPVLFNGLTESETNASASVMGVAALPTQPEAQATPEPSHAAKMLKADVEYVEQQMAAATQQAAGKPVGEVWGWAVVDKHNVARAIRPKRKDFFGCVHEDQRFTTEEIEKMDLDWAGIAPHRVVTLYTRPAPGVPDFANLLKVKEVDWAEDIDHATKLEARAEGWNECREEVLRLLAAAQAKGADK